MITSKQRAFLRSEATKIQAIMQVGKSGINDALLKSFSDALEARELIKIHVLENSPYEPKEALEELANALNAEPVATVGRKIVLYRPSEENPTIVLP